MDVIKKTTTVGVHIIIISKRGEGLWCRYLEWKTIMIKRRFWGFSRTESKVSIYHFDNLELLIEAPLK